ncbi:MAG: hypothetical protein ACRDL5_00150 [Solirubrobacteraceae bacterium]
MRRDAAAGRLAMLAIAVLGCAAAATAGAAVALGGAATRTAATARAALDLSIQAVYDGAGNPSLIANFSGPRQPRWSVCAPPDTSLCRPAPGSHGLGSASAALQAGSTPAGTVFEASARYRGRTYVARTAPWLGPVHAATAPQLSGTASYGAEVTPHAATWVGGWQAVPSTLPGAGTVKRGANSDELSVEACRTPDARRCMTVASPYASRARTPRIGAWFTGWYLFAIDQRFTADEAYARPAYGSAAVVAPVTLDATAVRSAPLGPVIGPPRRGRDSCARHRPGAERPVADATPAPDRRRTRCTPTAESNRR